MRGMMNCSLNGEWLLGVDERICIENIEEETFMNPETEKRAWYGEYLLNAAVPDTRQITVTFMIKERDRALRNNVLQRLPAWAKDGFMQVRSRPGQRIYVRCTQLYKVNTFKWTDRMKMVFTAFGEACWEDITPTTLTVENTANASGTITPKGNRACFLEAEIKNVSNSPLTSVTLAANGKAPISLSGLNVAKNSTVTFTYDSSEDHILSIRAGGASALSNRTSSSPDDLLLTPDRGNTVSCETDVACTTTFSARGLWR